MLLSALLLSERKDAYLAFGAELCTALCGSRNAINEFKNRLHLWLMNVRFHSHGGLL